MEFVFTNSQRRRVVTPFLLDALAQHRTRARRLRFPRQALVPHLKFRAVPDHRLHAIDDLPLKMKRIPSRRSGIERLGDDGARCQGAAADVGRRDRHASPRIRRECWHRSRAGIAEVPIAASSRGHAPLARDRRAGVTGEAGADSALTAREAALGASPAITMRCTAERVSCGAGMRRRARQSQRSPLLPVRCALVSTNERVRTTFVRLATHLSAASWPRASRYCWDRELGTPQPPLTRVIDIIDVWPMCFDI